MNAETILAEIGTKIASVEKTTGHINSKIFVRLSQLRAMNDVK